MTAPAFRTSRIDHPEEFLYPTLRDDPFLQGVVIPEGIKVHLKPELVRRHGFVLRNDAEATRLIELIQHARTILATMPPSAGAQAVAAVAALTLATPSSVSPTIA